MKKLVLLLLPIFFLSCSARMPSPHTAQKVTAKFFKKYGKKYKETDFGQYPVTKVEIGDIHEIQKNLASINAYVILGDSQAVHQVNLIARKKGVRWLVLSWEDNAGL